MKYLRTIDTIHFADKKTDVNPIWGYCQQYIVNVLEEILHDNNLLERCYCEHRIREYDRKFLPNIFSPSDELMSPSETPLKNNLEDIIEMLDSRVILILGDVGTGKSTFVHHFFKIKLPKSNNWDVYSPIFIDFKKRALRQPIENFISETINSKLNELFLDVFGKSEATSYHLLRQVFSKDLMWNEGLYQQCSNIGRDDLVQELELRDLLRFKNDKAYFNRRRLEFYQKITEKRIVIVFDNVDHLTDPNAITDIYLTAQSIAISKAASIIITMRTYNAYGNAHHYDSYSAFNPRYLHLTLPDVTKMLEKRVKYALDKISVDGQIIRPSGPISKITVSMPVIKDEVESLLSSFCDAKIIETLKKLSFYDLREILRMAHRALASGHIYPRERRQFRPRIQVHDLINALILGNWEFFNPMDEQTLIINLFDDVCDCENGKLFLRIRLLDSIRILGANAARTIDIISIMKKIGFKESDTKRSLQFLIKHSLVSPLFPAGIDLDEDNITVVLLTQKGSFYLDTILKEPRYYENLKHSTYIDENFFSKLDKLGHHSVYERCKGTRVFIEYICQAEKDWETKVLDYDIYRDYFSIGTLLKTSFNGLCDRINLSDTNIKFTTL